MCVCVMASANQGHYTCSLSLLKPLFILPSCSQMFGSNATAQIGALLDKARNRPSHLTGEGRHSIPIIARQKPTKASCWCHGRVELTGRFITAFKKQSLALKQGKCCIDIFTFDRKRKDPSWHMRSSWTKALKDCFTWSCLDDRYPKESLLADTLRR